MELFYLYTCKLTHVDACQISKIVQRIHTAAMHVCKGNKNFGKKLFSYFSYNMMKITGNSIEI